MESKKIDVLDKGYVILHDVMGSDLTVSNSARVSYDKRTEQLTDKDVKLIRFLAKHDHLSPFRHATLQFEVYAPLEVARQHWKYVVGSDHSMDAWNESSRRYVTEEPTFYIPKSDEWRSAPENKKQGSGEPIDSSEGSFFTNALKRYIEDGKHLYELALQKGIATEVARLFLPAYSLYVRYYWTASLQSVAHFLNQRLDSHAQYEIQQYAKTVYTLAKEQFPVSIKELVNYQE